MKKLAVIVICLLTCSILLTGCTDKKKESQQNQDVGNAVEFDDKELNNNTVDDLEIDPASDTCYTLPDGIVYEFKDPNNTDGIVVTPRE